jgi:predicted amidohydrolase YtcJ
VQIPSSFPTPCPKIYVLPLEIEAHFHAHTNQLLACFILHKLQLVNSVKHRAKEAVNMKKWGEWKMVVVGHAWVFLLLSDNPHVTVNGSCQVVVIAGK